MVVVMQSFPEADPDVEQSQAAAQSSKKSGGDDGTQPRERQKKIIVGPLRHPGQNYEQNSSHGADQHEKKHRGTMQPRLHAVGSGDFRRWADLER